MADSPGPNADLVLKGLDAEISRLTDQRTSPGWTNWAVSGTVGAVLWALAGLSAVHFSVSTAQLILALSLCIDLLHALWVYLAPHRQDIVFGFRSTRALASQRVRFIFGFARACVLIWALVYLGGGWWTRYALPGIWAYTGAALNFVVRFIATWQDALFPLANTPRNRGSWGYALGVSMSLSGLFATLYVGTATLRDWTAGLLTGDDLRFAGGVVAIIYLLGKLASDVPDPSLEELVSIRRDLAFGRIDSASAVKRADVGLAGVTISEVVTNDFAKYRSLLETTRHDVKEINAKADNLMQALPAYGPYSYTQLSTIHTVVDACRAHVKSAKHSVRAMEKTRVHSLVSTLAVTLDHDVRATLNTLRSEGAAIQRELDVAHGRLEKELLPLLAKPNK